MKTLDFKKTGILLLMAVFSILFWKTSIFFPFKIMAVFIHELSHALVSILTGGNVLELSISSDESGFVKQIGGNSILTASAGYVGSTIFGGILLVLASKNKFQRYIFLFFAVGILFVAILYVRNIFGITFCAVSILIFYSLFKLNLKYSYFFLYFLGITSSFYAIYDLTDFLSGGRTDAVILSEITFIPAMVWAVLWSFLALAIFGFFLKKVILKTNSEVLAYKTEEQSTLTKDTENNNL
ncbi:M50 family metallopeptidase [bacterium]|nr:M50 family metallopeptidase [bacterium]